MSEAPRPRRGRVRRAEQDDAIARIEAWGKADHTAGYDLPLHSCLGRVLLDMASRRPSALDPFLLPMA